MQHEGDKLRLYDMEDLLRHHINNFFWGIHLLPVRFTEDPPTCWTKRAASDQNLLHLEWDGQESSGP